ncbi:MAG: zf-TFIIB domain-containing protein [Vicinamibacteria bacterium]
MVEIDRRNEEEWFRRNERELLEKARKDREKREAERAAGEQVEQRKRLKDLHFMKCPKCGHDMKEETLDGVAIDRCSFCEGIYFDAGEIEDLMLKKLEDRRSIMRRILGI